METNSIKICNRCFQEKPLNNFYKLKISADGYKNQCKECIKQYYRENKDRILEVRKQYCHQNRNKINEYNRNKRITDYNFRISCYIRNRLNQALKSQNTSKNEHTFDLIGCSINNLIEWLEFTKIFYLPQNYEGKLHIDHFKPISKFNLNDEQQLKQACHWSNLIYLTAEENLKKNNKSPTSSDLDKMKFMKNIYDNKFQVCKCFDE